MLSSIFTPLLYLHIFAGTISLVLFWLPILSKKGRQLHKKSGLIYTYAMGIVVVTACLLSFIRLTEDSYIDGLALLFLAVLTLIPLVSGIQVLKAKKPSKAYQSLRLVLAGLLFAVSVALLIGWYTFSSTLLLVFSIIGFLGSLFDFKRFLRSPSTGKSWLRAHYEAMLFSGAAAYTAFFAFGGRALLGDMLTGWWSIIPWILPTLLTISLLPFIHKRYKQT